MAAGTEKPTAATESQEVLMITLRTTDPGELFRQVTALKKAKHYF
jgi:hypothetical protein